MNNNKNSIGIYITGLETKERAIFDRVITFNVTHGLISHYCDNFQSSDIIISSDSEYTNYEHELKSQKVLLVSNETSCHLGDVRLKRPLLITRVMKALNKTIDLVKVFQDQANNKSSTNYLTEKESASDIITTEIQTQSHLQRGHHALIIDDSAAIRKQLELELRDAGISADFAESGEEALEKIEDNQYDIIFLDVIMPGIDGYETCQAIRTKASYKKTPIIMLSGKTSPLDEVQGVIAGATTYLTKPVKSAMLQETLSRVTKWLKNFSETDKEKDSEIV